ncbi:MAG: hypothetical protein GPOALKHO_001100 [Sodalis sp.]|nr:MAG: hypothetical protein GPOALKHO_001100 [Sodalis sp.]
MRKCANAQQLANFLLRGNISKPGEGKRKRRHTDRSEPLVAHRALSRKRNIVGGGDRFAVEAGQIPVEGALLEQAVARRSGSISETRFIMENLDPAKCECGEFNGKYRLARRVIARQIWLERLRRPAYLDYNVLLSISYPHVAFISMAGGKAVAPFKVEYRRSFPMSDSRRSAPVRLPGESASRSN